MAGARQFVDEFLAAAAKSKGTLIEVRITTALWNALVIECEPLDPTEVYKMSFTIDDNQPTVN